MRLKHLSFAFVAALVAAPCVQAAYYSNFSSVATGAPFSATIGGTSGPDGWTQSYATQDDGLGNPVAMTTGYNIAGAGLGISGISVWPDAAPTYSINKTIAAEPVVGSLLAVQYSLVADNTYPERNAFSVGFSGTGGNIFTFTFTPAVTPDAWTMSYQVGSGAAVPFAPGNIVLSDTAGQIVVNFAGGPILDGPTTMGFTFTGGGSTFSATGIDVSGLTSPDVTAMNATMYRGSAVADQDAWGSNTLGVNNFVVVPEPSTALLSVTALGLLGLRRRRA